MTLTRQTPTKHQKTQQQHSINENYSTVKKGNGLGEWNENGGLSGSLKDRDTSSIPCKFFRNGKCSAGWDCVFSHQIEGHHNFLLHQSLEQSANGGILNVCKFFLKGACRFGSKCALLHIYPDSEEFLDYNGPSSFNSAITARYLDGQTPPPPPPQQLSNLPPPLSTVKLPSPESLRNPVAPVPVRRHSMADLFRWSVDQCSDKPSGNFLFYSSSLARSLERVDGDEGNDDSNETIADITAPSSLISRPLTEIFPSKATTVYNTSKPNTPDPFSPFPEDYFDDLNESTEFANNKNNSSNSVGPLQTEKADESSEESFCFDPANDMSFGVEEPTRNNFSPLSRPTTMEEFDLGQPSQHSAALRCQLCHNEVMAKGKFGIMVCEHIFCLSCIRSLRANRISAKKSAEQIQQCPICPVLTPFIVPSFFWLGNPRQKQLIFMDYQMKIGNIPCKFFNFGDGFCPFSSECYYSHTTQRPPNGIAVEESIYGTPNGSQTESIPTGRPRAATLSDFFSSGGGKRHRRLK